MKTSAISCVLFDLDGTLADTAPDLAGALNALRMHRSLSPLPIQTLRPYTSQGVRGLLAAGMSITPDDPDYAAASTFVLEYYANHIAVETRLFEGISALLESLETQRLAWGIVTNKHTRYTQPLVRALGLETRAACVVSGDTAARPKPAPDPLLYAAEAIQVAPSACIYVGDDRRDIEAGRAAGMQTIAVAWGYLGTEAPITHWGADHIIQAPLELLALL
jgi:N-acetyl-D-muramate 6-phosphate phosphatase